MCVHDDNILEDARRRILKSSFRSSLLLGEGKTACTMQSMLQIVLRTMACVMQSVHAFARFYAQSCTYRKGGTQSVVLSPNDSASPP